MAAKKGGRVGKDTQVPEKGSDSPFGGKAPSFGKKDDGKDKDKKKLVWFGKKK